MFNVNCNCYRIYSALCFLLWKPLPLLWFVEFRSIVESIAWLEATAYVVRKGTASYITILRQLNIVFSLHIHLAIS